MKGAYRRRDIDARAHAWIGTFRTIRGPAKRLVIGAPYRAAVEPHPSAARVPDGGVVSTTEEADELAYAGIQRALDAVQCKLVSRNVVADSSSDAVHSAAVVCESAACVLRLTRVGCPRVSWNPSGPT